MQTSTVSLLMGRTVLASALFGLAACVSTDPIDAGEDAGVEDAGDPDPGALFRRLGGDQGVEAVIDQFLGTVGADPKINGYFINSSVMGGRLRTCLIKQLKAATGGEATYPGPGDPADGDGCRNMVDAHRNLGISSNDFADLTGALVSTLRNQGVAPADIDTISRVLGTLAGDIIENPDNDETIYLRAGRKPGVTLVINDFINRVLGDPKINGYFLNNTLDAQRLTICLVRQVCSATGGPCKYGEETGDELIGGTVCKSMLAAHEGLGISQRDFDDLAGHLIESLRTQGVRQTDIDLIVAAVGPLSQQIVEDPTNDGTIYQRMGRKPAVQNVINDFIGRVVADPKINGYFLNVGLDPSRLGTCLVRQVCGATGGPCKYGLESGPELMGDPCKPMNTVHMGLGISIQDFNDLAGDLVASLTASSAISQEDLNTVVMVASGLATDIVEDQTNDATIYQRIGRKPAIQIVINDFLTRVLGDNTLVGFFDTRRAARLGTCLVRQVCDATGGPCAYGMEALTELYDNTPCRDMMSTHSGLRNPPQGQPGSPITKADFDALVGHLVDAMVASGAVSPADQQSILDVLGPLCPQIVEGGIGC